MTRLERKEEKLRKEIEFIDSIANTEIDSKIKGEFCKTSFWKNFRDYMKKKFKVDFLTGRKLTKTWNLHHLNSDSKFYTVLNEEYFLCLNNQMHDFWHIAYEETLKNPDFLNKVAESVNKAIELNHGKSFIYKKKSSKD